MSKIVINFSDIDPATNEVAQFKEEFSCHIGDDQITYVDNNNTNHQIMIGNEELTITSQGEYDVTNHYSIKQTTQLFLKIPQSKEAYVLGINTKILEISKNEEQINIELKYDLFEDTNTISNHHIFMEVIV